MQTRDIDIYRLQPTLQDLKDHMRITDDTNDRMLMIYLSSAVLQAEHVISRNLAPSICQIETGYTSLVTLPYMDESSSPTDLEVLVDGERRTWTLTGSDLCIDAPEARKMSIRYHLAVASVEDAIQQAILLMAAQHFSNPLDRAQTLPTASENLLAPYRQWKIRRILAKWTRW